MIDPPAPTVETGRALETTDGQSARGYFGTDPAERIRVGGNDG